MSAFAGRIAAIALGGTVLGAAVAVAQTALWSYEGATGPEHWGSLSPAYIACTDGSAQSPVDIRRPAPRRLRNIAFTYAQSADVKVVNNGHTVEWEFPAGSSITIGETTYSLVQMHFHAASEHRVNGRSYPLELHIVHRTEAGAIAVVGFLVTRGARNEAWAPLVAALPASGERELEDVALRDLMPSDLRTFRYAGSLTTPPCTGGVSWNVMRRPIEMSASQIAAFQSIYDANRRPLQPLNGRRVVADTSRGS